MKARDLDKKFDSGESIMKHLNLSKARRPGQEAKRVEVGVASVDDCLAGQGSQATGCTQAVVDQDADRSSP